MDFCLRDLFIKFIVLQQLLKNNLKVKKNSFFQKVNVTFIKYKI